MIYLVLFRILSRRNSGEIKGGKQDYLYDFYLFLFRQNKNIVYILNNIGCVAIVDSPSLSLSVIVAERLFYNALPDHIEKLTT